MNYEVFQALSTIGQRRVMPTTAKTSLQATSHDVVIIRWEILNSAMSLYRSLFCGSSLEHRLVESTCWFIITEKSRYFDIRAKKLPCLSYCLVKGHTSGTAT